MGDRVRQVSVLEGSKWLHVIPASVSSGEPPHMPPARLNGEPKSNGWLPFHLGAEARLRNNALADFVRPSGRGSVSNAAPKETSSGSHPSSEWRG